MKFSFRVLVAQAEWGMASKNIIKKINISDKHEKKTPHSLIVVDACHMFLSV